MAYEVAIIEDQQGIMDLYLEVFEELDPQVDCIPFLDGSSALEKIKTQRYDLIICDLKLPDMSGLDIIRTIRNDHFNANSLVYIVSGSIDKDVERFAEEFDDIKVFEKPLPNKVTFVQNCIDRLGTRQTLTYSPELLELVRHSAFELLNEYFNREPIVGRCQLNPLNTSKNSLRGFIPFDGPNYTGSLAVDIGKGFINVFNEKIGSESPFSAGDIAYEMANELAGKLKATILKEGYDLTLGIPSTMKLGEVDELRKNDNPVVYIPAGYIGSLFRIEFNMSITDLSQSEKQEEADTLAGGEVLLF